MTEPPLAAAQIDVGDVYQAIELYYERGWTDGLPVVPPTEGRVRAFLAAAALEPGGVLGEIPERDRILTAEHHILKQRHRIREVLFREKPFLGNIAPEPLLAEMAAKSDVVITGVGD